MRLDFGSVVSLITKFVPPKAARQACGDDVAVRDAKPPEVGTTAPGAGVALSLETQAILAPLDLPPDGPFDTASTLRARLTPDAAASNFVRWAQALNLAGTFSKRSIYSLYCEFSEVDHRPPVRDIFFLTALARTEGVLRERRIDQGGLRAGRPWLWTIEPAAKCEALEAIVAETTEPEAPTDVYLPKAPEPAIEQQSPIPLEAKTARQRLVLARSIPDDEHPFSPAKLRERAKGARRARLNAAASRKQRGALRRAA